MSKIVVMFMMSGICLAANTDKGETKIGFVDLPQLFYKSQMGLDYLEKYKAEYTKREKELQPKEGELKTRMQRFEERKAMMSPQSLKETQQSLQDQMKEFQTEFQSMRTELQQTEEKFTKEVMAIIFDIVKQVSADEHYDFVFEKRSLLFGGEDLTPKIMKVMNEQHKKKKKK